MVFLATLSVDDKGASQQHRSVTQILCYLSVASNMATIIIGLLLMNQHNTLKHGDVAVVVRLISSYFNDDLTASQTDFLDWHWQEYIGFERLSIIYSTPYALLIWG